MKVILIMGSIVAPLIMLAVQMKWHRFRLVYHSLAIIALLLFGNILSLTIHQILMDNTVFMTNIHGVLLNPVFLMAGAYLGIYLIYVIGVSFLKEVSDSNN